MDGRDRPWLGPCPPLVEVLTSRDLAQDGSWGQRGVLLGPSASRAPPRPSGPSREAVVGRGLASLTWHSGGGAHILPSARGDPGEHPGWSPMRFAACSAAPAFPPSWARLP